MLFEVENSDWRKTGVYCITNIVNNKIYIGSTSTNFRHRYLQYKSGFKRELDNQPVLYKAFKKYGFENFKFEILSICSKEDCIVTEQLYINKGTDYNSCLIAGSLLGFKHKKDSKTRTVIGGLHHTAKKVYQFTIDGEYIQEYGSIVDALKALNKSKKGSSHITEVCLGTLYSSFGFRWSFSKKLFVRENRLGKHKIRVLKEGFQKDFNSQVEAAKYFNSIGFDKVNQGSISNALRLKNKVHKYKIQKI